MLQPSTFKFLQNLKANNNKPWFDVNRKQYESAKEDFLLLTGEIIKEVAGFDKSIGDLKPKDCTFRINRDIRFSKNKTPYKTNMAASFNAAGKKASGAGYYFHLEPGAGFAGGGCYVPMPPELAKIRQEIDYNFEEWTTVLNKKMFKKQFPGGVESTSTLVRPPKNYDENNPAITYLKMKDFIVTCPFTDGALQHKNLARQIAGSFEAMKPFVDFLNKAIE